MGRFKARGDRGPTNVIGALAPLKTVNIRQTDAVFGRRGRCRLDPPLSVAGKGLAHLREPILFQQGRRMLGRNVDLQGLSPPRSPAVGVARTVISRPRDFAFDVVARDFFKNYQRWCPQVVELEPSGSAPARVGMTARQVTMERGIRSESTFEIVAVERPRLLALEGISEPFSSSYEFECESPGTMLVFTFELREIEFSMRPFVKLIRAALQDGAEQIVENVRALIEAGATSAETARASR